MLTNIAQKKTSDPDDNYNCIAWAFGDNTRFWWPVVNPKAHWPIPFAGLTIMQAFEAWFAHDGWTLTTDETFEAAYKKVALYVVNGVPTHAARLIADGVWTSKLGREMDLSHGRADLDGQEYGSISRVYRKPA